MVHNQCFGILTSYPVTSLNIGSVSIIFGSIYVIVSGLTLLWIRKQRYYAESGIEGSVQYVIFPVYEPFMWCSAISDMFVGLSLVFIRVVPGEKNMLTSSIILGICYGLQHFVLEGIAFALMQYGCGYQAAKYAARFINIQTSFIS